MASQAGPKPFQSKINAPSLSRTPCTPNKLRVTASRSRSTLIVAHSLSRCSSRSLTSHSASIILVRRRIANRRMAIASASTARSSRCYAVPCRSAPTTGNHFFLSSCILNVPRRHSRLASRRLVSCSDARCDFRPTLVPHFMSNLVTFARTRTYFSIISSVRISLLEK